MHTNVQPLPPSAQRALERYLNLTAVVTILLIFGPIVGAIITFGRDGAGYVNLPEGWGMAVGATVFVGSPAWGFYRWLRIGRVCRCPGCGGWLRNESWFVARGFHNLMLTCRGCGVTWDSEIECYRDTSGGG